MHFRLAFCYSCCLFSVRYRCIWGRCGVSWHPRKCECFYLLLLRLIVPLLVVGLYFGYRSIRPRVDPPQTRSFLPSFWDVPPLVLGRSAPPPIGLSMSYFATNSSTEPIAIDLLLQFMTFTVYRPTFTACWFLLTVGFRHAHTVLRLFSSFWLSAFRFRLLDYCSVLSCWLQDHSGTFVWSIDAAFSIQRYDFCQWSSSTCSMCWLDFDLCLPCWRLMSCAL